MISKKKAVKVTEQTLEEFLGVPKYRYGEISEPQVGIVTGLAWTDVGADARGRRPDLQRPLSKDALGRHQSHASHLGNALRLGRRRLREGDPSHRREGASGSDPSSVRQRPLGHVLWSWRHCDWEPMPIPIAQRWSRHRREPSRIGRRHRSSGERDPSTCRSGPAPRLRWTRATARRERKHPALRDRTREPAFSPAASPHQGRDGGCRFPGCTHDRWLHAHHIRHWANGGATDSENLVTLCGFHHRLVHDGRLGDSKTTSRGATTMADWHTRRKSIGATCKDPLLASSFA